LLLDVLLAVADARAERFDFLVDRREVVDREVVAHGCLGPCLLEPAPREIVLLLRDGELARLELDARVGVLAERLLERLGLRSRAADSIEEILAVHARTGQLLLRV